MDDIAPFPMLYISLIIFFATIISPPADLRGADQAGFDLRHGACGLFSDDSARQGARLFRHERSMPVPEAAIENMIERFGLRRPPPREALILTWHAFDDTPISLRPRRYAVNISGRVYT